MTRMQLPAWKRVIPSVENQTSIVGSWLWTLVYCGFSFWMFWFALFRWKEFVAILITGFFAAWGVAYFFITLWVTLQKLKFGDVSVTLEGAAPVLGGEIAGSIQLPREAAAARYLRVEIECNEEIVGDKGQKSQQRVWYRDLPFPVRRQGFRYLAEFKLKIADEPVIERGVAYKWALNIRADLPGVDFSRTFPVDVRQGPPPQPAPAPVEVSVPAPVPAAATPVASAARPPSAPVARLAPAPVAVADEPEISLLPGWALIAANLVPLAGVLVWHWKVGDVVLLYWIENLVIGVVNVLKIALAEPQEITISKREGTGMKPGEMPFAKLVLIAFFIVHYGAFCGAHGTFLADFFPVRGPHGEHLGLGGLLRELLRDPLVLAAIAALVVSHLVSFRINYIGRDEYRHVNIALLMMRPYGRIFVTHLFIIFGGFVLMALKSPAAAMALFVALKIGIDFHLHRRERELLGAPPG